MRVDVNALVGPQPGGAASQRGLIKDRLIPLLSSVMNRDREEELYFQAALTARSQAKVSKSSEGEGCARSQLYLPFSRFILSVTVFPRIALSLDST